MPRWYDKAVNDLDEALARGEITREQHSAEMRELNAKLRQAADDDFLGGW